MGVPVILNVYDLSPQNNYMYWAGFGIFHTGVEVFGIEYAYGGHDYDVSGIFATNPRQVPGAVRFRESICVGETNLSQMELQQLIQKFGEQYKGNRYHLLQKNCNHFASDLCFQLVGKAAPGWTNRLADMAVMLHCLLPTTWVPPLQPPSMPPVGSLPGLREDRMVLITSPRSHAFAEPPRAPLQPSSRV